MRDLYPGYFQLNKDELATLLKSSQIVFDTSSLLTLYRFSDTTRVAMLDLMGTLCDRVWIPTHVINEYLKNRIKTICDQAKEYANVRKDLDSILQRLTNISAHPFVDEDSLGATKAHFSRMKDELENREKSYRSILSNDPVMERFAVVFEGRIKSYLNSEQVEGIIREGRERYERRVPPGYMDQQKPEPDRYGDFIIWNELIHHANAKSTSVLFVSDDLKEDWMLEVEGMKLGPRPELVQEFYSLTKQRFHLLGTARLMELASGTLGVTIEPAAINEAKDLESQLREHAIERRYAVPKASRSSILRALSNFDSELRNDPKWLRWRGRHKYAILYDGKRYPVKTIISLASGISPDAFSGGAQANNMLKRKGFTIVQLKPRDAINSNTESDDNISDS